MECPGVIGAHERGAGIALAIAAKLYATVRASVVQHADLTIHVTHHDHGLPPDLDGDIVTALLQLCLMAAVDPGFLPDVLHLPIENLLVGVDRFVYAVGFDQSFQRLHAIPPRPRAGRTNLFRCGIYCARWVESFADEHRPPGPGLQPSNWRSRRPRV